MSSRLPSEPVFHPQDYFQDALARMIHAPETPAALELIALLRRYTRDMLDPSAADRIERVMAAWIKAVRTIQLHQRGIGQIPQWPRGAPELPTDHVRAGGILDHPYHLMRPDGETVFISEPYEISEEGVATLNRLAADGWSVRLRADRALHFPGATIAIRLAREDDE